MSKFSKRISKLSKKPLQNALVVGKGFGFLPDILEMFGTVFLISKTRLEIRARNLVYKENFDDLNLLVDITHVFYDLENLNDINQTIPVISRWKSIVIIEGPDIPHKEYTQSLMHLGYKCYRVDGFFHPWELK